MNKNNKAIFDVSETQPFKLAIDYINLFIPQYINREKPYNKNAALGLKFCKIADKNGQIYRIWTNKISTIQNPSGYTNLIEENGGIFHEINEGEKIAFNEDDIHELRLIFCRTGKEREYYFLGLFEPDLERSYLGHRYFRRIASKVDFSVNPPIIYPVGNINTPLEPEKVFEENFITKVICANCGSKFKKAKRCPECGQLQDYKES